mgnify:CR=1 FL=1
MGDFKKQMNVVLRPVYGQEVPALFTDYSPHILKKPLFDFRVDERPAVFCTENHVDDKIGKGMGHILSPLWGWDSTPILPRPCGLGYMLSPLTGLNLFLARLPFEGQKWVRAPSEPAKQIRLIRAAGLRRQATTPKGVESLP